MLRFIQDSYSRGVLYPHNRKLNSTKAIIFLSVEYFYSLKLRYRYITYYLQQDV